MIPTLSAIEVARVNNLQILRSDKVVGTGEAAECGVAHIDGTGSFGRHRTSTAIVEAYSIDFTGASEFSTTDYLLGIGIVIIVGDRDIVGGVGVGKIANGVEMAVVAEFGSKGVGSHLRAVLAATETADISGVSGAWGEVGEVDAVSMNKVVRYNGTSVTKGDTVIDIGTAVPSHGG